MNGPRNPPSQGSPVGRRVRPQIDLTEWLRPRPAWRGPLPEKVGDLPRTAAVEARVAEYGGPSAVDQMLRFLAGVKGCLDGHVLERPGGLAIEVSYDFDEAAGILKGADVTLDQSAVGQGDDLAFLDCARRQIVGRVQRLSPDSLAELKGTPGYAWRAQIHLPIEADGFYPWLLTGERDPRPAAATVP